MKTARTGVAVEPADVQVLLEGVDLPAEGVAPHGDVETAEGLWSGRASAMRSASMIIPAHEP